MALILNIETATNVCSVALAKDANLIAKVESDEPKSHAGAITAFIQKVISENNFNLSEIDAVAVSKGPGSYTGLRIGVATAKGLCYALNKPLISVNTLEAMTAFFLITKKSKSILNSEILYAPLIDARRMEVYTAVFNHNLDYLINTKAEIITEQSFEELLDKNQIVFFGDGVNKCISVLNKKNNAVFVEEFKTSSEGMISLTENAFNKKQFEDVAYFEPFYLKDFVTTTPKNR